MGFFSNLGCYGNIINDKESKDCIKNIRNVKFETFISDIDNVISKKQRGGFTAIIYSFSTTTRLAMIFDYDKLNDYGKIIMENSALLITSGENTLKYTDIKEDIKEFKNQKLCIDRAKEFIKYCRMDENKQEGYKFVFWSLMVLTVDKTDAEENLSLICDFSKMLNITDAEMEDIIHVIKIVYNEVEKEYQFKTETIPNIFGKLFNLYKNNEIPIE